MKIRFGHHPIQKGAAALVLTLIMGSSVAAYSMAETGDMDAVATDVSMAPGADETERNFSWYSPETEAPGVVEITRVDADGEAATKTVKAQLKDASHGFSGNEARIAGLQPNAQYVYRIGDGKGNWSGRNTFTTRSSDRFNFLLMGDPQIGSSWWPSRDRKGWNDTLKKAVAKYPDTSFIQSVGDQVDNPESEKDYRDFLEPEVLKRIPAATTIGNHDNSPYYGYHFNVPNEASGLGDTKESGGDYYFTYGDALFMNLNTNSPDTGEHAAFMEKAVQETASLEPKWKIVVFHHSIYSVGGHAGETEIINLRKGLVPSIDALEIDAVLMGHDHSYARTYQMKNFKPTENQPAKNKAAVSPEGTVYLTANSSSGSKYYDLSDSASPYVAVKAQLEVPTFTNVEVTPSSLSFETYRTDTMKRVDRYKIIKPDKE